MSARLSGDQTALLDFAVSHSPVVFYTADPADDFRITFISDNIERLSGHAPGAITADPGFTRRNIHDDDLATLQGAFSKVTPEQPQECEYRFRHADGEYIWFREELRIVADDDAGSRVVGCMTDITERVEAERERKRLDDLLHDAVDLMPTGLIVYDAQDRVVLCNEAVVGLYGPAAREFLGRHATEMAEIAADHIRSIDGAAVDDPGKRSETLLARYRAADGKEFEAEYLDGRFMLMSIQRTDAGCTVVTRSDITERKAAQSSLEEREARFRAIAEAVPLPVVIVRNRDREVVFANRLAEDVLGTVVGGSADILEDQFVDPEAYAVFRSLLARDRHVEAFEAELLLPSVGHQWNLISARVMSFDGESATLTTATNISDRKRAEQQLAASEIQHRTVLDNTPLGITHLDRDRRYIYANPAYCDRIGKTGEEIIGLTVVEVVGQAIADITAPYAEKALSGDSSRWQRWQTYESAGDRFMERIYQPDLDADGKVVGYFAFTHDLTELKEAESSIEEREARFRTIAEAVPLPLIIVRNRNRDIVFANRLAEEVVGAVVGASADGLEDMFVDPDARAAYFSLLARKRRVDGFEAELRLPDKGRRWHLLSARVMTHDGDSATLTTCTDITDRKRAEQRLLESEIQHRTVLENVPSEIEQYDRDRRYVYANPAYCERLGKTQDEIVGQTVAEVVGQEVSDDTADYAAKALSGESAQLQRWQTYEKAGDRFMQRIYQPDFDADGNVVGYFAFTHDLTELKEAQSALEEREARFRAIAGAVPMPLHIVDNQKREVVFVNEPAANELGTEIGMSASELENHFVDPEQRKAFLSQLAKNHHVPAFEAELRLRKGGTRWCLISSRVMEYDSGSATLTTASDITDRRLAEQALADSEMRHRSVLENIPARISQIDAEGRFVYATPAFVQPLGVSVDEILGRTMGDVMGDAFTAAMAETERKVLSGELAEWQGWAEYPDGRHRYMLRIYQPNFAPDGRVDGFFGFGLDLTELKQAQMDLEERETRFRAIAEAMPLRIVVIDKEDRRVLFTNELATRQMDVRPGDPSRKLENTFVDVEARAELVSAIMGDRGVGGIEAETRRADGSVVWELIFGHDMTYDGRPAKFTTSIDITDRKRAEQALRESEGRFKDFAESASDWFWETDENFRLTWFSTEIHPLSGEPTSNLLGGLLTDSRSYHAGDTGLEALQETVAAKQPFKDIHVLRDIPDGGRRDLSLSAVPFFDDEGRFKGYRGSTSDITEQKRAQNALRASEAQTRTILDNIPAHVVLADKNRRLTYVNRRYREFRKMTTEESLGRTTAEVLGNVNSEILAPLSEKALAGESVEWQGWLTDPVAGELYHQRVYQPYRGSDGEIEGYLTFVRDLTDQKHTEQELEQQRELLHQNEKLAALGSLLAGVAHELNNPLSVVVGRSIMLADEVEDPAIANAVGRIRDAAERCARIVKTFLAMARQQAPSRQPAAINDLVHASLDMVEYNLRTTDVKIELELADDLPLISADPDQLSQVLVNLCINSGQAMETADERRLTISTAFDIEHDRITVDVIDTGSGISAENMSRIFDPFFTTKPLGVGTGVGLSISHAIVTSHDGTIDVSSKVGHGTTFHLSFPVGTGADAPETNKEPQPKQAVSSILIVDDEVDIADMLAELLGGKGHRVEIAHSGREALSRMEHAEFDLIISDLKMPDIGGRELYRLVESDRPQLRHRFLFITGDTLGADAATFIADTGLVCMEKPLLPSDVIAAVDRALEQFGA